MEYTLDEAIERAAFALKKAKSVAILTGAGASAESGVPTFRASDGLWEGHRIDDVATPEGFNRDPKVVWRFYNGRRANVAQVQPNPGHEALVKLEERWGDDFALITQNVDGLHQKAGSIRVFELHGSLYRTRCTGCRIVADRALEPLGEMPECPSCGALLRPDIVWFKEMLPQKIWQDAALAAALCDVLIVVGTSAVVHPAASLIPLARDTRTTEKLEGATVIEVNLPQTEASDLADIGLYGRAGEILPQLVDAIR